MIQKTTVMPFHLSDDNYLFFDIFYKDNNVYLILPIYNTPVHSDDIKIKIENGTSIALTEMYTKDQYEPIQILIYNYPSSHKHITVYVEYANLIKTFELDHIPCPVNTRNLSITTLFLDDYKLFTIFYDYYKCQGVEHFYMYYNGLITQDIIDMFNQCDVTLIEWDFKYWNIWNTLNGSKVLCKYLHHAQLGQMHHAIYKYGKNVYEYMIFCDMDEYLHIPNYKIKDFVLSNNTIDTFGFRNRWSVTLDNTIPQSFPKSFLTSSKTQEYSKRSKNIHKLQSVHTISIHYGHSYNKDPKVINSFVSFHFYNWSTVSRTMNVCDMMVCIE